VNERLPRQVVSQRNVCLRHLVVRLCPAVDLAVERMDVRMLLLLLLLRLVIL
jgi:hypothetical protein